MFNKFRYYLTYQGIEVELAFSPKGWDTETIGAYRRSMDYFGMVRSYATDINFVKDGAEILRQAYAIDGIEAGVILRVDIRKRLWDYETIFKSDLDFSTYKYDGTFVTINLMESGISKHIKANENKTYEFQLGSDAVNMVLPGVVFKEVGEWISKYVDPSTLNVAKRYVVGQDFIGKAYGSGFVTGLNTANRNAADTDNFNGDAFIRGNRSGGVNINVTGYFNISAVKPNPASPNRYLQLLIRSTNGNTVHQIVQLDSTNGNQNVTVDVDFNYTLQNGEGLYIYSRPDISPSNPYLLVTESDIKISYSSVSDPSNCKGFTAFQLFEKLMNRVSPGTPINSVLLTSNWRDLIFTSGTAIRELPDAKIKISLRDFFGAFKGLEDAAMGTDNGVFRLETGSYFARSVPIMDVGNVNKASTEVAEEFMGNLVQIGYDDGNTNKDDGREEYNSKTEYGLSLTRIIEPIDWVSPVRADQYGIENLRVTFNVTKEATSDNEGDNDNFMVHCNPINGSGNYTPILGSQMQAVSGVVSPLTAYNLLLSPKHNLLRHSGYLRSILDLQDARFIEFNSGEKNTNLSVTFASQVVKENTSVPVSSLGGKYFRPIIFNITAKLPRNAMQIIDGNPFGYVTFNYNGINCKGYIIEMPVDLGSNSAQDLRLLAKEDSDVF